MERGWVDWLGWRDRMAWSVVINMKNLEIIKVLESDSVLNFLGIRELAVLQVVNKSFNTLLSSRKLIKKSLYLTELPSDLRIPFWKHFSKFSK